MARIAEKKIRQQVASLGADAIREAVAAAHARAAELTKLGAIAARNGVDFDLPGAIAANMPLQVARARITEGMAALSESMVVLNRSTAHTAASANTADGWAAALETVVKRQAAV